MSNANDLLMGGGVKSATFPNGAYGHTVAGTITQPPTTSQQRDFDSGELLTWSDGNPKMQIVVTLQTDQRDPSDPDDNGMRVLYIKASSAMQRAVRDAVKASGAKGLEVGGVLAVRYDRDEPNSKGRGNPKKIYSAAYTPPAQQAAHDTLMGNGHQPAPVAPPMPAPVPVAAPDQPPPGIDPAAWAAMPEPQKAAVRAALAQAGNTAPF